MKNEEKQMFEKYIVTYPRMDLGITILGGAASTLIGAMIDKKTGNGVLDAKIVLIEKENQVSLKCDLERSKTSLKSLKLKSLAA